MRYQTISLCMIVKNEEHVLSRCLESVKGIVDEVIIVDTGSTDRTVEIAEQHDARVYSYKWENDFAAARNYALEYATCDYILSLDADEWLDNDSKALLLEPLEEDYYFLRIRNIIRAGVVETHSFIRLYKRAVGFEYEGALHEQIDIGKVVGAKGEHLPVYINHDGYTKINIEKKEKHMRNMGILEKEVKRDPSAFNYFNLGTQYKLVGQFDKAIEAYKIAYSSGANFVFSHKLIINLVQCLTIQKRYNDAIKIINDSIALHPEYTDFRFYQGSIYFEMKYFKDAERSFLTCLELGEVQNHLFTSVEGVGSYMAQAYLAQIYLELGEKEKAQQHIVDSIKLNPIHVASLKIWLDMFLMSEPNDMLRQLLAVYTTSEQANVLLLALYQLRNPLFVEYINHVDSELDCEVKAWQLQVNGDLDEAKKIWLNTESISATSFRDVLYLAVVTRDELFYRNFEKNFNLRQKDNSFFRKVINGENCSKLDINEEVRECFSDLCYDLLMLRNFDAIEGLIDNVKIPMLRFELASQLQKFQFTELALNVLCEPEKSVDQAAVFSLAADLLNELGDYGGSYHYLIQTIQKKGNYEYYLKLYLLAKKVGDRENIKYAVGNLCSFMPKSPWAHKESSLSL